MAASTTAMNPTPDPAAVPAVCTRLHSKRVPRVRVTSPMSEIAMNPRKAETTDMFGP